MANSKRLSIIIGAIDKLSGPMTRINGRIEKLKAPVDRVNRSLNKLGRQSGLKKFNRDLRKSVKHAKAAGRAFAGAAKWGGGLALAGGGAIAGLASSYAAAGDSVAKTSLRLGIGVEALQEYRYAADRSGIATATFDMALQRFGRRAGEAAKGMGEARGAIKALGIDLKDSSGNLKGTETLLTEALNSLGRVKDPLTRNALAMKLFDSEGVKMVQMAAAGAEGIKAMRQEAQDLGLVMSEKAARSAEEFTDKTTKLGGVMAGLRNRIGEKLLPVLNPMIEKFAMLAKNYGPAVSKWADGFAKGLPERIDKLWTGMKNLGEKLSGLATFAGWISENFGLLNTVLTVVGAIIAGKLIIGVVALAGAFKTLGIAMMTTPIGWIVAGIASVVAAGVLLYKNWDAIKAAHQSMVASVVGGIEWVVSAWNGLKESIASLTKQGLSALIAGFGTVKNSLASVVKFALDNNPFTLLLKAADRLKESIASLTKQGLSALIAGFGTVKNSLASVVKFALNNNPFTLLLKGADRLIKMLTGFSILDSIQSKLQNILPQWAIDLLDLESSTKPVSAPIPNARAQVGGTVHVKIDSEGRPRVQDIRSDNTDVGIMVDAGMAMAGP